MAPNLAFVLLVAGLFGILAELTYPGRVLPGTVGAFAALAGASWLWRHSDRPGLSPALVAVLTLLFCATALYLLKVTALARRNKRDNL